MPIYEYRCAICQMKFEALRSIKDADAPIVCSHCQSIKTHRVQSACFSKTDQHNSTSNSSGCSGCNGGTCSSCSH